MQTRRSFSFLLTLIAATLTARAVPELRVPDGFAIELVAGPPLVMRPICADLDAHGHLFVAESSGSNENVTIQLEKRPHRILRLEDVDGDGVFDKRTVFADGMMLPEGILCHDGAVYCGAPPSIWKLEDTTGDGIADRRSEWWKGETLTGCANDVHGPYLGPDGFLYWTKGAFAKQTHHLRGGRTMSDSAAHIYRARPDGSEFDCFLSGGMDNPVEIAWDHDGNLFFTTTFFTNPRGGLRDAIVNGVYGGVYPKVHGVLDGLVRTGDLLPAMTHLGPAAPCGLTYYGGDDFGPGFRNSLFCCQFNTHKVSNHVLQPHGSTFTTLDSDFVTSDSPDFHPTDVLPDRDGSLLVIDTGGWYKLCCPSSQLAKPEVPGAIYRVRRVAPITGRSGAAPAPDLAHLPQDPLERLAHPSPFVRLNAASTLAQSRDKNAVPALLAAAGTFVDRQLEHAIIYALIEIADPQATALGLRSENAHTRRAALIAIDQMTGGGIAAHELRAALDAANPVVSETAWWLYELHPERAAELVGHFDRHPTELGRLAKFANHPALRPVLHRSLGGALASRDESQVRATLPALAGLDAAARTPFATELVTVARDETLSPALRLEVIALLPTPLPGDLFPFLSGLPDPRAAAQLARAELSATQLSQVLAALPTANPLQLPHLLDCFRNSHDEALGNGIIAALDTSNSLNSLREADLDRALAKFPDALRTQARQLLADRRAALADPARIEQIAAELPEGDSARGHLVFNSAEAACLTCHAIGYRGGDFGPGLSRIGSIRSERDLLEAIVTPSASLVRSYETVSVRSQAGGQQIGIIADQSESTISLRVAPTVPAIQLARDTLSDITPVGTSMMPAGLDQQLSRQQLADLIAFLKSMQ